MMSAVVKFIPESAIREQVRTEFLNISQNLTQLLPEADIQHVGSTAIPGALTKGDLDINVRIPADRFQSAERILGDRFERKPNPSYPDKFSYFKNDSPPISIGIQLTVIDSEFDFFWKFRDLLLQNPELVTAYNQIKQKFNGKASAAYRVAKSDFIEFIISSNIFKSFEGSFQ